MSARIKKGDVVQVISGNHKGESGKVISIMTGASRVVVEGVCIVKKHAKKTQSNPQGGVIDREGSLHISNVRVAVAGVSN